MKPMRVIVTGSRDWADRTAVWGALDHIAEAARTIGAKLIVAHGCAEGADKLADEWCRNRRRQGWPVEAQRFPADWRKHGRARAGHIRNAAMVKPGADACLAFINPCKKRSCAESEPHGSHGTEGCVRLAEGADIPVQPIERFEVA